MEECDPISLVLYQPLGYFSPKIEIEVNAFYPGFIREGFFYHPHIPISGLICTLSEQWVPGTSASHNNAAENNTVSCLSFLSPQDTVQFPGCYSPRLCFPFIWCQKVVRRFLVCIFHYWFSNMKQKGLLCYISLQNKDIQSFRCKGKGEDSKPILSFVNNIWQKLALV